MGQYMSNECQEVVPGLYIGHVGSATDVSVLESRKIRRIVDLSQKSYKPVAGTTVLRLDVPDVSGFDISQVFPLTNGFISRSLKSDDEPVLVHCAWGISRSASVVLAYLMKHHNLSLSDSIKHLRSKRSIIKPNRGFMQFLRQYENQLQNGLA